MVGGSAVLRVGFDTIRILIHTSKIKGQDL